jgi:hypothetical protein
MTKAMNTLPAEGTKDRKKLEAMLRLGSPYGVEKRELQEIDGNGGWGTYKNDGKRYADFLGGTLHRWGSGQSERYWIELSRQSKWSDYFGLTDVDLGVDVVQDQREHLPAFLLSTVEIVEDMAQDLQRFLCVPTTGWCQLENGRYVFVLPHVTKLFADLPPGELAIFPRTCI